MLTLKKLHHLVLIIHQKQKMPSRDSIRHFFNPFTRTLNNLVFNELFAISKFYSVLMACTGLLRTALIDWRVTVINAMPKIKIAAKGINHHSKSIR